MMAPLLFTGLHQPSACQYLHPHGLHVDAAHVQDCRATDVAMSCRQRRGRCWPRETAVGSCPFPPCRSSARGAVTVVVAKRTDVLVAFSRYTVPGL